jgi:excisionase family DNA binding protein
MAKLLSIDEVSQALGVSTFTVRRLVKSGKLHSVRVGKRLLLPETEVARVIAEGCEGPAPLRGGSINVTSSSEVTP